MMNVYLIISGFITVAKEFLFGFLRGALMGIGFLVVLTYLCFLIFGGEIHVEIYFENIMRVPEIIEKLLNHLK